MQGFPIFEIVCFVILYGSLEYTYLKTTMPLYVRHIASFTQHSSSDVRWYISSHVGWLTLVTYIILFTGAWVFVMADIVTHETRKTVKSSTFKVHAWKAMIFGLCVYGVYNLTNMASIPGYKWPMAVMDTVWGVTSVTFVAWILWLLQKGKAFAK